MMSFLGTGIGSGLVRSTSQNGAALPAQPVSLQPLQPPLTTIAPPSQPLRHPPQVTVSAESVLRSAVVTSQTTDSAVAAAHHITNSSDASSSSSSSASASTSASASASATASASSQPADMRDDKQTDEEVNLQEQHLKYAHTARRTLHAALARRCARSRQTLTDAIHCYGHVTQAQGQFE